MLEKSQDELNNTIYNKALELIKKGSLENYILASNYLKKILDFKDSNEKYKYCIKKINKIRKRNKIIDNLLYGLIKVKDFVVNHIFLTIMIVIMAFVLFSYLIFPFFNYQVAMHYYNDKNYYKAMEYFENADGYKDSYDKYDRCESIINYSKAVKAEKVNNYGRAAFFYAKAGDYKDAKEKFTKCYKKVNKNLQPLSFYDDEFIGVNSKGKIFGGKESFGYFLKGSTVNMWENIISVYLSDDYILAISNDGNLNIKNSDSSFNQINIHPFDIKDWKSIVSVDINKNTIVGVQSNGKANIISDNETYKDVIEKWDNLLDVKVQDNFIVGLKKDGTVVAEGLDKNIKYEVSDLKNIKKIECSNDMIACLTSSGNVIILGDENNEFNVSKWKNIKDIAFGDFLVGVKSDGSVVQTGGKGFSQINNWSNIIKIYTCNKYIVGIKKDGSVVVDGKNCKNIKSILSKEKVLLYK